VLSQTSPGDTVLVGPGRYLENLVLPHSCTILGTGESVTILESCAGGGSVVRGEYIADVVLADLALENGTGSLITGLPYRLGGGALFNSCPRVRVERCRIEDNTAERGGGIWQLGGDFHSVDSRLGNNFGDKGAGALDLGGMETVVLQGCELWWDQDDDAYLGAILVDYAERFEMTGCTLWADASSEYYDVITGMDVSARTLLIDNCAFWDRGTTATATVADLFPFAEMDLESDVSVMHTVIGASHRLEGGSFLVGCWLGSASTEHLTLVNRNLILMGSGSKVASFRNCIAENAKLTLIGPQDSDGSCNVFWNADVDNRDFDLAGTRIVDPLLCDPSAENVNVEEGSPCRPEHSGRCGWIGARDGSCAVTPVLISGMEATPIERGVEIAWSFDGIEPHTDWAVWRLVRGEERLVSTGHAYRTGRHSVEDRGPLPSGSILYELRIMEPGLEWRTASSAEILLESPDGLIAGPAVVSRSLSLHLPHDTLCRVIDSAGRVRRTLVGQEYGLTSWDLRDDRGRPLESGVYWTATADRSERFVIVR
jgi:hypothetical protein